MDWFNENMTETLFILGLVLLCIEILVLGFSTFILFFIGLALLLIGGLLAIGVIENSLIQVVLSTAVLTAILAAVLWQPLKRMQEKTDDRKVTSDFDGMTFILGDDIDESGGFTYAYSGINWQVKSAQKLSQGTKVVVERAEVGVFWVTAYQDK
ncbi:NfeD family protein [Catenovulum sp. SM1970]|uniref:NfeD family protein n=1 Tax=Marinifaba aquimaris TaxID=2741323 RepID=UPI0015730F1F|nr:NfeD family protein [Marinifaba aquimaris]NTS77763.1 NfeD family protein [Marinifaba aquimaris]